MIIIPKIFDVTANENAHYKRNEWEHKMNNVCCNYGTTAWILKDILWTISFKVKKKHTHLMFLDEQYRAIGPLI